LEDKYRQDHEFDHSLFHDLSFPDHEAAFSRMTGSMLFRLTPPYYSNMLRSACSILLIVPPGLRLAHILSIENQAGLLYFLSAALLGTHPAIIPPSIGRMLPVVQRDSSDAK
jgi:hypothetical protein